MAFDESEITLLIDEETLEVVDDGQVLAIIDDSQALEIFEGSSEGPQGRDGPPGPAGADGDPGPPGPTGGISHYLHTQGFASTFWTVIHDLGYIPAAVQVTDSAGTVVYGSIQNISVNELTITFSAPFSGFARVS